MPKYIIEQYELHMIQVQVDADSAAEAVKRLMETTPPMADRNDCSEFLEVAERYGLSAEDNQEFFQQLRGLGVPVKDLVPGIRQVYRLRDE